MAGSLDLCLEVLEVCGRGRGEGIEAIFGFQGPLGGGVGISNPVGEVGLDAGGIDLVHGPVHVVGVGVMEPGDLGVGFYDEGENGGGVELVKVDTVHGEGLAGDDPFTEVLVVVWLEGAELFGLGEKEVKLLLRGRVLVD